MASNGSNAKIKILNLTPTELRDFMISLGEPSFRADQVMRWIYKKCAVSFDEMSDLPHALREKLVLTALISTLHPVEERISSDTMTRKALFRLDDGNTIETAYMAYGTGETRPRGTVCVSSQVGCPVRCPFCMTGQQGFQGNLTTGEILEQVRYFCRTLNDGKEGRAAVTNVVFMGMGEPLRNYENVVAAVAMLNSPSGLGLAARQITISTAGEVPGIKRLVDEGIRVELAVSLHAATDQLRNQLVPLNRAYPLSDLLSACRYFYHKTGRRPTFEYSLFKEVNDSAWQAVALASLLKGLNAHVNLITGNSGCGDDFQPSTPEQVKLFKEVLLDNGILATVRQARGQDIEAGCGQLRSHYLGKAIGGTLTKSQR